MIYNIPNVNEDYKELSVNNFMDIPVGKWRIYQLDSVAGFPSDIQVQSSWFYVECKHKRSNYIMLDFTTEDYLEKYSICIDGSYTTWQRYLASDDLFGVVHTDTNNRLQSVVKANATSQGTLTTPQIRDISAGTNDLTAGSSQLANGTLYFVYEL